MTTRRLTIALAVLMNGLATCAVAQNFGTQNRSETRGTKTPKTIVRVELVTDPAGAGTVTVDWGRAFEKLGYNLRIRAAMTGDMLEVREQEQGSLRIVTAVGELERDGTITFSDRKYRLNQAAELGKWLRDLETFGAQGSPKGRPLWGLNEQQFEAVFTTLAEPFDVADAEGKTITSVVAGMSLPDELPIVWSTAAEDYIKRSRESFAVKRSAQKLSRGTTLAFLLRQHGLGMQPLRTPTGAIELVISPLGKGEEFWPIGWPPRTKEFDVAPHMFKPVPVELVEVPLLDVFEAIEERTELPILVDFPTIAAAKIDLAKIEVSYPNKQTTWNVLLKAITTPSRLTRSILVDEAGTPFVWVTEFRPNKPKTTR